MKTHLVQVQARSTSQVSAIGGDPAFTPFVAASPDEIRYAERLRERLKERYPDRPAQRVPYWSVGAD
ncbi:MAG TPA: hypothetical protein VFF44_13155 [Casimicrobiaceae bacterium]|nr:hypothetical protein [Casimicrobiaceae bacterium]